MSNPNSHTFGADHFDKVASTYEPPRSSNPMTQIAKDLISFAPSITSSSTIHDNAAGTGVMTGEILEHLKLQHITQQPKIYASDISTGMLDQLLQKSWPGVEAAVMDSQSLSYPDGTFSHSFMNMGIFLLPRPEKGTSEVYRTLKEDGVTIITSIKRVDWIKIFQTAQRKVSPDSPLWKGPMAEEWSTKEKLQSVVVAGGFKDENIRIEESGAEMSSDKIGGFLTDFMKEKMTALVTEGWCVENTARFKQALDEELQRAMDEPYGMRVECWVCIARK